MTAKKKREFLIRTILILSLLVVISLGFFWNYTRTQSQNSRSESPEPQKEEEIVILSYDNFSISSDDCRISSGGDYLCFAGITEIKKGEEYKRYYVNKKHPIVVEWQQERKLEKQAKLLDQSEKEGSYSYIPPKFTLRYKRADRVTRGSFKEVRKDNLELSLWFSEDNHGLELIEQKEEDW